MNQVLHHIKFTGQGEGLLQHNVEGVLPKDGKQVKMKELSLAEQAELSTYRLNNGQHYIRTCAFRMALIKASTGKKIGGKALGGIVKASVFFDEPRTALYHPDTEEPIKEYTQFDSITVTKATGARLWTSRALIKQWSATIRFSIDYDRITPAIVIDTFMDAGEIVGVGAWRIQNGGVFGKFTAELVD